MTIMDSTDIGGSGLEGSNALIAPEKEARVDTLIKTEQNVTTQPSIAPVPFKPVLLVPSLRGKMYRVNNSIVCKGLWAMTDAAHVNPEATSEFEFILVHPSDPMSNMTNQFPVNGTYKGWFNLRKQLPLKGVDKIDEKDIKIVFSPKNAHNQGNTVTPQSSFDASNSSLNSLHNPQEKTLTSDAQASLIAKSNAMNTDEVPVPPSLTTTTNTETAPPSIATAVPPVPPVAAPVTQQPQQQIPENCKEFIVSGQGSNKFGKFTLKGSLTLDAAGTEIGDVIMFREYIPKIKTVRVKTENGQPKLKRQTSTASDISSSASREGAGRVRKQSALIREFETSHMPATQLTKQQKAERVAKQEMTKAQKLTLQLQKCLDLVNDMMDEPQGKLYFSAPVDPIALNIPDYPLVITNPMDFGTIKANLIANKYVAPTEFAEHMRLVFKNAISYNSLRDNPVHIAAKACNRVFEDKYKSIISMFAMLAGATSGQVRAPPKKKAKTRPSMGSNGGRSTQGFNNGGNVFGGGGGMMQAMPANLPPDGSYAAMQEMQRRMAEMQNELLALRTAVGKDSISQQLTQRQIDAQNPLTYEEKASLVKSIHNLPAKHMSRVVSLIQEVKKGTAGADDEEDVEIPLDELDTHTLRKLQSFVESCKSKLPTNRVVMGVPPVPQQDNAVMYQQQAPELLDVDLFPTDSF